MIPKTANNPWFLKIFYRKVTRWYWSLFKTGLLQQMLLKPFLQQRSWSVYHMKDTMLVKCRIQRWDNSPQRLSPCLRLSNILSHTSYMSILPIQANKNLTSIQNTGNSSALFQRNLLFRTPNGCWGAEDKQLC